MVRFLKEDATRVMEGLMTANVAERKLYWTGIGEDETEC